MRPRVRRAYPVGTVVRFKDAQGLFRLASDLEDAQSRVAAEIAEPISLSFVEIVNP